MKMAVRNRRLALMALLIIIIEEKASPQTANNATMEKKAILDATNSS